jgi:hypothetical protein
MSDPTRAVRWQSSAIVVAALISTTGAVSSALIQTGWFGKSPAVAADVSPLQPTTVHAAFTGAIESAVEHRAIATEAAQFGAAPAPTPAPALIISKPLIARDPPKTNRKPIDWEAIPRFFNGLK